MKKLTALLLAAVVCLSLVACGGTQQGAGSNGSNENTNGMSGKHPLLQFLYGEWEYEGNFKENYPFAKLTINEDGTCIVDGVAGKWTISSNTTPSGRLCIDVFVNGQVICGSEISIWAGNYNFHVSNISVNPGDNWKHNTPVVVDDNDIVLSTENWHKYFKLIIESSYSENAFGDVELLVIKQYLVPKEEYADKIIATDVIYEVQKTKKAYSISINAAEKTHTIGEILETGEPSTPEIQKLWCVYETNRYEINVATDYIDIKDHADPNNAASKTVWLVADIDDINMLRIQGNIYIINE